MLIHEFVNLNKNQRKFKKINHESQFNSSVNIISSPIESPFDGQCPNALRTLSKTSEVE